MIYAFAIPLVMGVIPYTVMVIKSSCRMPISFRLWNSAIATFTTGCIIKGVLDIYGTTNSLVMVYPIAGVILIIFGWLHALKNRADLNGLKFRNGGRKIKDQD